MTLGIYPKLLDYNDKCRHKKSIDKLLNFTQHTNIKGIEIMKKHLKEDPLYECYFCNGYNYNCEAYEKK